MNSPCYNPAFRGQICRTLPLHKERASDLPASGKTRQNLLLFHLLWFWCSLLSLYGNLVKSTMESTDLFKCKKSSLHPIPAWIPVWSSWCYISIHNPFCICRCIYIHLRIKIPTESGVQNGKTLHLLEVSVSFAIDFSDVSCFQLNCSSVGKWRRSSWRWVLEGSTNLIWISTKYNKSIGF